ncbi:MAG: MlaD family protein [Gemmatimonadaceae bacterium]
MPRQLHWTDLRGGLISAAVIVALVLAIVLYARVGALHGKKVTLYVLADDATGVLAGTEVWLAGKHSGTVKEVSFRAAGGDTIDRLIIMTEFLANDLSHVRRDSWAQIQAGGKLLGTPVVYVAPGSVASPGLRDGDTIRSRPKPRAIDVAGQVTKVGPEFRGLMTEVATLNKKMSSPVGTIGAYRAQGMPALGEAADRASRITGKLGSAGRRGTIGLGMSGSLGERASRVMAAVDSVMTLMSSDKGSIGRFRRDTTLMTKAGRILAELDSLRAHSKFGSDSSLTIQLARRRVLMDALMKDIKANPQRYISY